MCREDFQCFVRPMYLLANFSGFLLIALPANQRVVERARNFCPNVRAALLREGYALAGFTAYPSDDLLLQLRNHLSFAPFIRIIWRGRIRKLEARRAVEDARDRSPLDPSQLATARTTHTTGAA